MARKTLWREEFVEEAEGLARREYRNLDIARHFGVTAKTFQNWLKKKPKLVEALREGRRPIVFEMENKLLEIARGITVTEVRKYYKKEKDKKTGTRREVLTSKEVVTKEIPPNMGAILSWLSHYDPDKWREVKDINLNDGRKNQELIKEMAEKLKTLPLEKLIGITDNYKEALKGANAISDN